MSGEVIKFELPVSTSVVDTIRCFADSPSLILLDSASHIRERDARYSFLTSDPVQSVRLDRVACGDQPFEQLRKWQQLLPSIDDKTLPPFCGGIAGLMSYELGEAFEVLDRPANDDFQIPALSAGLFDWCICWDHICKTVTAYVLDSIELRALRGQFCLPDASERLNWIKQKLAANLSTAPFAGPSPIESDFAEPGFAKPGFYVSANEIQPGLFSSFSAEQYLESVNRVVEYIRAGDIFQANLSQQLTTRWRRGPVQLYECVRALNPAPFCGLMIQPDFAVVSASPERFLKVSQGRFVETRPIKGTRRRQKSPIADLFTTDELTSSEKDRAENVMIVDLLRNDLSRSCRAGTVRVSGLCEVELFETVQHLVSTVVGELCSDKDIWDLCAGCFPGGSITGAPKIRAMEIIAELEPAVRGAYCGSLFCCGPQGDFDSSILIRTFTLKQGVLQFPVGGGIVADSDAADEYRETMHKASGMLRVLKGLESQYR